MPLDLSKPLSLPAKLSADQNDPHADVCALLRDLPGNILKGHGREHTLNLFLHFKRGQAAKARQFLHWVAAHHATSAWQQITEAREFKASGQPGAPFVGVFLTAKGYAVLGIPSEQIPRNPAFRSGLKDPSRNHLLHDPPVETWEAPYQQPLHVLLLLADTSPAKVNEVRDELLQKLANLLGEAAATAALIGAETGRGMRNANGDGIEHFGYVDGRSQPLFLQEDLDQAQHQQDGIDQWNPAGGLAQVLVPDPGGRTDFSFGSYFVFRKLEQNVRGFKKLETQLAEFLGLKGDAREIAGALVVGRFEDGTPVVLQGEEGGYFTPPSAPGQRVVRNNFNFAADPAGTKCPFHAHIRKTNPRGEGGDAGALRHQMARRGITYGQRDKHPNDASLRFEDLPTGGVGLLFMAYMASIEEQFEFMQHKLANNPNFLHPETQAQQPATGLDPVIGQGPGGVAQRWPTHWGKPDCQAFDFHSFVTLLGGEYFFAPSLSFLASL